ncbi:cation-translocating P-type ATPase [Chelativorans xinjiangense]|uniref:cation-translocating P-type ATPase n=1 Tax=Chelativorans xinjiangense TaxID=2681485 RepID=UPI00135677FD|nr:cation-translocating P-type ATPase [Chelativorans xinjiangense]
MSCCAPGAESALDLAKAAGPAPDEIRLASRALGDGLMQTDLAVPGVHCGACIQAIESALGKLDGVVHARVNLSTKRVSVKWRGEVLPPIAETFNRLGYAAHLFEDDAGKDETLWELIRAVAVAGFAAGNIMLLSVSVWSGADEATRDLFHWISALIAIPALVYAGRIYFRSAWNALSHGRMNMDVPIALGVSLAYGMSLYETIHHGQHAYFDASVSLLFFLLIGRTLDHVMRQRARTAVTGLARLSPRGAMVVREDGGRDYLPLGEIAPGMRLLIAAGERIPVDGIVRGGTSDIDCSMATGESAPQVAEPGASVRAGMLNLTQPVTIEALAAAKDSFLAEMMRLMEAAEGGRARYRRLADRVSALYSPLVHLTALLTFAGWMLATGDWHRAITIAIAVLIITCPCALGLAVPIVQVVAARRLFENGIMVKDGSAMERLAEIDMAVFDKTGTLTMGSARLENAGEIDAGALALAGAIAAHSRHPLSQAVAAAAGRLDGGAPRFDRVEEIPGCGIEAKAGAVTWRLGRAQWALGRDEADGTVLARNGIGIAVFRFEDRVRPGAEEAVGRLEADGIPVEIMSGDEESRVALTAKRLGVEHYRSGVLPDDKANRMAVLAAAGHKVLMVGDGLNDAPALAASHVSMAPVTAADIGRNAADFVFLREKLTAVPVALDVARRSGRLIRQNFALAIGYNALAVPIAVLGYVTPLLAAVAMSVSSLLVIGNALRLSGAYRAAMKQEEARSSALARAI